MQLLHLHRQISLNAPPPQNNPDHILDDMVSLSFYVLYSQYIEPLQSFTCVDWLLLSYTFYSKKIQQMGQTACVMVGRTAGVGLTLDARERLPTLSASLNNSVE